MVLVPFGVALLVLGWLWVRWGWWAALLAAAALAYGVRAAVLRRRSALARKRRQAVRFTLDQIDGADDRGFRRIVGRLLVRDGWVDVRGVHANDAGAVHLVGHGPDGRRLGVAFERGVESSGTDGRRSAAALRPVSAAPGVRPGESVDGGAPALLLVVSSGSFARERVLWAVRSDVRLVDRPTLERWASGEDLAVLLALGADDVLPDSA
ncbi:hypothetical protein ACIOUE_35805 [Streptomyces xanthochromogenes]|uniref:hypothetical protein n=1 Tax=Streptomyces xanthochromogenes TaxID=67384 RepID=UPI003808FD32